MDNKINKTLKLKTKGKNMMLLTRRSQESIVINKHVEVMIIAIQGPRITLKVLTFKEQPLLKAIYYVGLNESIFPTNGVEIKVLYSLENEVKLQIQSPFNTLIDRKEKYDGIKDKENSTLITYKKSKLKEPPSGLILKPINRINREEL